jgi:hypothetical protein
MGNAESSLGDGSKELYAAAKRGDAGEVQRLAAAGAGLEYRDAKGRTPLVAAVVAGHSATVHLVRRGPLRPRAPAAHAADAAASRAALRSC